LIWHTVEASAAIALKDLHRVIQAAMGWENAHLYQFHIGGLTINGPGFDPTGPSGKNHINAARLSLDELIADGLKRFGYCYDMGDNWEHELHIENIAR
jgi:hypothetical protein